MQDDKDYTLTDNDLNSPGAVLRTVLISDLVGSTRLIEQIGDQRAADLFARHDRVARDLLGEHQGREIDKTDGFLMLFERPLEAVAYALSYHRALDRLSQEEELELSARVGIHLGEVFLRENTPDDVARGAKPLEVEGLAKPTAARLMSLAQGRQTLLTRGAFDVARRAAVGSESLTEELEWLAHGPYRIQGVDEPTEVFEVGIRGSAPLEPPPDSDKVQRADRGDAILGWRPAAGQPVARRENWLLDQKVGAGGFGEVWLARHQKTGDRRVFKFCFDAERLRALQREITVFRLLKEELGDRPDIARILDWSFDQPPYFIESEYTSGGSLIDWVEAHGGLDEVALESRLEIVAQVADALAAAHSVGVLHRDIKPGNVLIHTRASGEVQARLCDFGMGVLTEEERLASAGITVLGMTRAIGRSDEYATTSGTLLYNAPELVEGKAATIQADIYALGVVLYQLVVGNLFRALGPGWERGVESELLHEDIAAAVDVNPERRLASALDLAERLRSLEARGQKLEEERREQEERQRAVAALAQTRKRQKLAAALFLGLAIFAVAMLIQSRRVAREAERANQEALAATEVSEFLVELFEVNEPGPDVANTITARELLDRGAEKIEERLEEQPLVQARLMQTMSRVYQRLGLYREAVPLAERALARRDELLDDSDPNLRESLSSLGGLQWRLGELEEAERHFVRELALVEREDGDDSLEVAVSRGSLGLVYLDQGRYREAEEMWRRALAIKEKVLGPDHSDTLLTVGNLGVLYLQEKRLAEALPLFQRVADTRERLYGRGDRRLAASLNNLGAVYMDLGRRAEAESVFLRVLAIREETLGGRHPLGASTLHNLGMLYRQMGRYEDGESHFLRALEIFQEAYGAEHADIANALLEYAHLLRDQGRLQEAESSYRRALEIAETTLPPGHFGLVEILTGYENLLRQRGRTEEAAALAQRIAGVETARERPR